MSAILVVAEHAAGRLNQSTARAVACAAVIAAQATAAPIDVVVLGAEVGEVAAQAAGLRGIRRVLTLVSAQNAEALAAVWAPQIAELAADYSHVLGPSTTFGKDLMPRVAALLGVAQISDIMSVQSAYRFQRPIYAGNAIVTVETNSAQILVATVRTASFAPAVMDAHAPIEARTQALCLPSHTRFVSRSEPQLGRPDLQTATRVVSGGRALASADNFQLLYRLADALGAAVGASRAAVDAGYVPNDMQVGQTGKIIAPELYVALGISGAIQHLTGIKDARTIVAINKDAEAPIFEVADIGLVGDLFQIVPELEQLIRARAKH